MGLTILQEFILLAILIFAVSNCFAFEVLDFEIDTDKNFFSISPSDGERTISISPDYHKGGSQSLKITWPQAQIPGSPQTKVTFDLGTRAVKTKSGGFKFWMYRENKSPSTTMQITFVGKNEGREVTRSSPTDARLDFKGWRAVWIAYKEFSSDQFDLKLLTSVEFTVTSNDADTLYLDLVQATKKIKKQSRDIVVRLVGQQTARGPEVSTFYSEKDFWQQTLNWFLVEKPAAPRDIEDSSTKEADTSKIEERLENWFASTSQALSSLTTNSAGSGYDFEGAKKSRWEDLKEDIKCAHKLYQKIQFKKKLPTLFTKESSFGEDDVKKENNAMTKFGFMFTRVLLPLSIEYNFMSRDVEKQYLANKFCVDILSKPVDTSTKAVRKIAGKSNKAREKLVELVNEAKARPNDPLNCNGQGGRMLSMEGVIDDLNKYRFTRIKKLIEFIIDQGWAEGSGLGSIDHQMNKAGSGFMNSLFLLRKELRKNPELFESLVGSMRWFNDFNEIYQEEDNYVYDGTTADRMRTTLLFRLMVILIDNRDPNSQILDMGYFKTWFKHALKINKGLGGVVKPDYTGFHHKTFYGSAYVPHALYNAALVQYLLDGTVFSVPQESKDNIRKSLEVLRTIAVKYSTPNGISGRFPGYKGEILVDQFPAFAYSCFVNAQGSEPEKVDKPEMFLRLFDTSSDLIDTYMKKGSIKSLIYYWNTIGAVDVIQKASTLQCTSSSPCVAEDSPSGYWSKNFGCLSVHRRDEWSVAAKGVNRYTWDYESSPKENVFGVFQSHGSLQISNSEEDLANVDINKGWDWTRVPGTTSIKLDIDQTRTSKARNYNKDGKFGGGVGLIGSSTKSHAQNGAFGLYYVKPNYEMKKNLKNTPLDLAQFEFKKSYFFYNELIVCLGSDIKLSGITDLNSNYAQTTLFQDRLVDPSSSSIQIDSTSYNFASNQNLNENFQGDNAKELQDTFGNIYRVEPGNNVLKVEINEQTSKRSKGDKETKGHYAVAYLKHKVAGSTPTSKKSMLYHKKKERAGKRVEESRSNKLKKKDLKAKKTTKPKGSIGKLQTKMENIHKKQSVPPSTSSYQYGIIISGGSKSLLDKYTIMKQDSNVHAIKLANIPDTPDGTEVYGYTVFNDLTSLPLEDGPVKAVSASCMIMTEKSGNYLYLAISDPNINFQDDPEMTGKATCSEEKTNGWTYNPKDSTDMNNKLLFCVEGKASDAITVTLNVLVQSVESVKVDGKETSQAPELDTSTDEHKLTIADLIYGLTTEVKLLLQSK